MSEDKSKKSLLKRLWADQFVKRSLLMVLLAQIIPLFVLLFKFSQSFLILYYIIVNTMTFGFYSLQSYIKNPNILYKKLRQYVFVCLNFVSFLFLGFLVPFALWDQSMLVYSWVGGVLSFQFLLLMIFFFSKKEKEKILKIIAWISFILHIMHFGISMLFAFFGAFGMSILHPSRQVLFLVPVSIVIVSFVSVNYFLQPFHKSNNKIYWIFMALLISFLLLFLL